MSLTIQPTTSVHSVGSKSSGRYHSKNIDDLVDEDDAALMENADIADYMPTNDEMNEQMIYSLSDDGKLMKRRYSRSQVLQDEDNQNEDNENYEDDNNDDELYIIPNNNSQHDNTDNDEHKSREGEDDGRSKSSNKSMSHPYQHRVNKPIHKVGTTKITLSQAKLFGLLDNEGNVVIKKNTGDDSAKSSLSLEQRKKYYNSMAKPNTIADTLNPNDYLDPRDIPTFKPGRSKEAAKAMKDPKCGYDFMDRLDSRGDFLDRVDNRNPSGDKKMSKSQFEALEQDYLAKHDKLQCPKCLLPQTFKEFFEKQRKCTRCNLKFEKLNVSSGLGFAKKNEMREKERLEKLRAIEIEMYGDTAKSRIGSHLNTKTENIAKPVRPSSSSGQKTTNKSESLNNKSDFPMTTKSENSTRPKSATLNLSNQSQSQLRSTSERVAGERLNKTQPVSPRSKNKAEVINTINNPKSTINVTAAVEKMTALNNQKAIALNKTIEQIQSKYGGMDHFLHYDEADEQSGLPPLPKKKIDSPRRGNIDNVSSKFERLTKF